MFYLRVSNAVVEKEEQITDWVIHLEGEALDTVDGYFQMMYQTPKSVIWDFKHVEIVDETGLQWRYYFQHKWLPENDFFPLYPIPEKLVGLVPEKKQVQKAPPV